MADWRKAVESGKDAEELRRLNKAVDEAKNHAVASGRKAARLLAVAENLAETARKLGGGAGTRKTRRPGKRPKRKPGQINRRPGNPPGPVQTVKGGFMRKDKETGFFESTRPGTMAAHGSAEFELPILYFRDDFFALYFAANAKKIRRHMSSDNLHPILLPNGKAVVAVGAFNYMDTSIGPYGEVIVGIPAVYGKSPVPVAPALLESRYPGFGVIVAHLPVTKQTARDGGRGQWGYTKFITEMHFTITPEFLQCRMSEKQEHILTLRVARRGFYKTDKKPIVTFSVKDGQLIRTTIPQKGTFRQSVRPAGSFLELGDHPVSESIRGMGLSKKPMISKYYVERAGILPAGEVIETNARPLEGYYGADLEGEHTVSYME